MIVIWEILHVDELQMYITCIINLIALITNIKYR